MSQEKIDRRKQEKADRKKNMAKERRMGILRKAALGVAAVALVGWLGYSAYDTYVVDKNREVTVVDYGSINDYLSGLTN